MMLSADFSSVWPCKGSYLMFGIPHSLSIPKSPHSITSYSLLILGRTLILLIHALEALCKRSWAKPVLFVSQSPSRKLLTPWGALALPSEAGRAPSAGRGLWQEQAGIGRGVRSSPQIWCCRWALAPRPRGFLGSCCSSFWRLLWDCSYNFISVIKDTRARVNFCPVTVGKLVPNDKPGFVLWHWVGACIQ